MQLYVLDRSKNVLATTDGFYNDLHHKELTAGASTYVFDLNKSDEAAQYMVSGNIITMLDDQERPWSFEILYYDEYQTYKTVHCEDVGINLFNKACDVWYYQDTKPFADYFNVITNGTPWELGVNQLADLSRTLTFTGRDTGLGRLLSVLKAFDDAECIFNIEMNGPVPVKYVIDVYKKIGTVQDNIQIAYNEELNDIKKTETRQEFVTALGGVGSVIQDTETDADGSTVDTDKPQEYVDFKDLEYDDGDFYTVKGDKFLRARTANQQFNPGDQGFIEDFYEYDTSDSSELFNRTLTQITTRSQPQFTYEADVKVIDPNLDIGDTVTIIDHDYNPALYLQARVATLEKSYTDSTQGQITFTNYVVLTDTVTQQIAALKSKVNGIKNGSSSYVWIRYADDDQGTGISQSPKGKTYVAILAKVNQPVPSDDPKDYAGHWVRIAGEDGLDGQIGPQGKDGAQGIPGKDGVDGKTSYTHIAYANSATGEGFSEQPDGKTYIGMYVDFDATDSTDVTKYNWSLVKGSDGTDGIPGKAGSDGKTPYLHIAYSSSADGKDGFYIGGGINLLINTSSSATNGMTMLQESGHNISGVYSRTDSYEQMIAPSSGEFFYWFVLPTQSSLYGLTPGETYTISGSGSHTSGELKFRAEFSTGSGWIGLGDPSDLGIPVSDRSVFTPFSYTFTIPVGATGAYFSLQNYDYTAGSLFRFKNMKLEKGSVATPWSPAPEDNVQPKYMGTYTDYIQADSTDPTQYLWSRIQGEAGANGKDGQDAYLHIAYANSVDGKTDFTTDQNQAHNRDYLGTYSDNTKAQSTDPTKYTWQLTRGAQGLQGQPGSKDVPVVKLSSTAPASPKDGDFWYQTTTDSSGQKITGFSVYSGGKWVPSKIDQSTLVLTKLVSVEIDSATINSPDITVPFDYFDESQNEYKGSMEFKDGMLKHISTMTGGGMLKTVVSPTGYTLDAYANQSEYTKNNPYIHTEVYADNISLSNANTKKSGILDSSGIGGTLNNGTDSSIGINISWSDVQKYLANMGHNGSKRDYDWFDMMASSQSHPNLIKNSSFTSHYDSWDHANADQKSWFTWTSLVDGNVETVDHPTGGTGHYLGQKIPHLIPNVQMCYSFRYRFESTLSTGSGVMFTVYDDSGKSLQSWTTKVDPTGANTSDWYYLAINPITLPSNTASGYWTFTHNDNMTIHFAQPMLNYGSYAAPYQPT